MVRQGCPGIPSKSGRDPESLQATRIERLTTGPGSDAGVAVSRDGKRLAFTANSQQIQTWLFPFNATTGQIKGGGNAITSPGRTSVDPNLSPDGTKITYNAPRGESYDGLNVRNELWLKSLLDGRETPVIADDYSRWSPHWSPDSVQLVGNDAIACRRGQKQGNKDYSKNA